MRVGAFGATWLARRVARRREGAAGLWVRRAWRWLARAGDAEDPRVIDVVWRAWLSSPCDDLWELLVRWRSLPVLAADACSAAMAPDRPPARRAAIGAFCARYGVAPAEPVDRALFFVLTGQIDRYRAADPDGSLLRAGYGGADAATRSAVREAQVCLGVVDAVWVFASDRAHLDGDERRYLVEQVARRGEWDRLWGIVTDLPPADAVRAVRLFPAGWSPPAGGGAAARSLFTRLAAADPAAVAAAQAAVDRPDAVRIPTPGRVAAVQFARDAEAVAVLSRCGCYRDVMTAFELPSGRLVEHRAAHNLEMVSTVWGFSLITARTVVRRAERLHAGLRRRYPDHRPETVAPLGDGQVALLTPTLTHLFTAAGNWLVFFDAAGRPVSEVHVTPADVASNTEQVGALATCPDAGLVALVGCGIGVWNASDPTNPVQIARSVHPGQQMARGVCFAGPERLVTTGYYGNVFGWHLGPTTRLRVADPSPRCLELRAERELPTASHPVWLAGRGQVAVRTDGTVIHVDPETLTEVWSDEDEDVTADRPARRDFMGTCGRCPGRPRWAAKPVPPVTGLWGSPDGRWYARGGPDHVTVRRTRSFDAVRAAVFRDPAEATPADLAALDTALAGPTVDGGERPYLELLHALVAHRLSRS